MNSVLRSARAIIYVRALQSLGYFRVKDGRLVFYQCQCRSQPLPNGLPKTTRGQSASDWIRGYEREICTVLGSS